MQTLIMEVRQSFRSLRRSPGFTLVVVLTIAVGIGATTTVFTALNRVVLDPLPYPESERLVRLRNEVPGVAAGEEWDMAAAQYYFIRDHARSIEEIGAYTTGEANIQMPDGPQRVQMALVSASTLRMLGARPAIGRIIDDADDARGATPVAVVSSSVWHSRFGGDPTVLGRTVEVFGIPAEIVGVLEGDLAIPPNAGGASPVPTGVWLPLSAIDARFSAEGPFYNNHTTPMIARLAPGMTVRESQVELDRLTQLLPAEFPSVYGAGFMDRFAFRTVAYPLKEYVIGGIATSLWILLGGVGLVLLIACANLANLFLVRLEGRRQELAIRVALGAGRLGWARRLLAEAMLLGLAGGVLGLLLSHASIRVLTLFAPADLPRIEEIRLESGIVLLALGIAVLVAVAVAMVPVARMPVNTPKALLGDGRAGLTGGRDRQRLRAGLISFQVALSLVLVVGAGLLLESFLRLRAIDPGFDPRGLYAVELNLSDRERYTDAASMWTFYAGVLESVRAVPGVQSAGIAQTLPLTGNYGCTVQGFEDPRVSERLRESNMTTCAAQVPTAPGWFETMGIPVLQGRGLIGADNDNPNAAAVVVSRAFAERFWPGEDPIGKGVAPSGQSGPFYSVVGVVGDVFDTSPADDRATVIYYPVVPIPGTQTWGASQMNLVLRTDGIDPDALLPILRETVWRHDPTIPIETVQVMQGLVSRSMARISFTLSLLAIAAALALALASIGLYGVVAYIAARRRPEIGIRIALGARAGQVQRLVIGRALAAVSAGLVVGGMAALLAARLLRDLLYGVTPNHPLAFVASGALLILVALLAGYLPARRASRMDPMSAVRME
jgi:putative ABC transport system permease protein